MIKKDIKNEEAALRIQIRFESRFVIFVNISQTQVFWKVVLHMATSADPIPIQA